MIRFHWDLVVSPGPLRFPYGHGPGCVLVPAPRPSFGFVRFLQWAGSAASVLFLVLLFVLGHEVEVVTGVLVAVACAASSALRRPARRLGRGGNR